MNPCNFCMDQTDQLIDDTYVCSKCSSILKNEKYGPRLLKGHLILDTRGSIPSFYLKKMVEILDRKTKEMIKFSQKKTES